MSIRLVVSVPLPEISMLRSATTGDTAVVKNLVITIRETEKYLCSLLLDVVTSDLFNRQGVPSRRNLKKAEKGADFTQQTGATDKKQK